MLFGNLKRNLYASRKLYILFHTIHVLNRITLFALVLTTITVILEFNAESLQMHTEDHLFKRWDQYIFGFLLFVTASGMIGVNRLLRYHRVFAKLDGIIQRRLDEMTDYVRAAIFSNRVSIGEMFQVEASSRDVVKIDYREDGVCLCLKDGNSLDMEVIHKAEDGGVIQYLMEDARGQLLLKATYDIGQPESGSPYRYSIIKREIHIEKLHDYYRISNILDAIARC